MKTLKIIAVLVLLLAAAAAGAAPAPLMGTSDGHDLDALYARAQKTYDLAQEDAVVLLDSRTVSVGDEGTLVTRVHTAVWIGTSQGIRHYADLRIPWNSATSTLDVEMLRTWRDGQWWPDPGKISDTAVVETLPYAVAQADDYTSLRETMLLHDGVELPCILETAYTIAVQGPPTAGADDVHVFPGRDPVLEADYEVRVPLGTDVKYESLNGAPEPVVGEDELRTLTWTLSDAGKLKLPETAAPTTYEPAAAWSTWPSAGAVREEFLSSFNGAAVLDPVLADSLQSVIRGVPERLWSRAVVGFVDRTVRPIHTAIGPWLLSPRPAARTWATGYGHAVDRAVLAMALLNALYPDPEGAIQVVLARPENMTLDDSVPRLSDFDEVLVSIKDNWGGLVYDPAHGGFRDESALWHRSLLAEGVAYSGRSPELSLDVSLEETADGWIGVGHLFARGPCGLPTEVFVEDGPLEGPLKDLLSPALPGVEVTWYRPDSDWARFPARVGLKLAALPEGADGRPTLVVGRPGHSLLDALPKDIRIDQATRQSPLRLPDGMHQTITVRLHPAAGTAAFVPAAEHLENPTGSFTLECEQAGGWLTITRQLDLDPKQGEKLGGFRTYGPELWPDLRALLLEEQDPANGTIVLEAKKK